MINCCQKEQNIDIRIINKYNKSIILGIEILRTYMCFSIVILHFLKEQFQNNFLTKFIFHCQPFYVPTFFLISFYFSFKTFAAKKKNINKIKERFIRIIIPYIIWPILLWSRNILVNYKNIKFDYILFKAIFFQLLIGYDFYAVFWFQFDLIVITIIITIIIFSFNNCYDIIFKIAFLFFYIINKKYEEKLSIYKQIGSIKPLLSSFIYSLTGFFLGSKSILKKFNKKKYMIFMFLVPAIFLIFIHKELINFSIRFRIIVINIVITFLFIIFGIMPFDYINNTLLIKIIKQITSFTGGIYYIHYGVRTIFSTYFKIFDIGDLKSCLINYLVCYFICYLGSIIFINSYLRFLFI